MPADDRSNGVGVMAFDLISRSRLIVSATASVGVVCLGLLSTVHAAESKPTEKAVLMVLMAGTHMVHIIEMPSMDRCQEAVQFTPKAKCVEAPKVGADVDRNVLRDFAPASGPSDSAAKPAPPVTYKPLN